MGSSLSIVTPLYFEEDCVEQFVTEVHAELSDFEGGYEIVFVDDGSRDKTKDIVRHLIQSSDTTIRLVEFPFNQGKQAALTAGIAHASGDWIIMMDPDLQDPPAEIKNFWTIASTGEFDLIWGVRKTKEDGLINTLFSRLFWWLLIRFTGLQIPKNIAVMRMFNRRFAQKFLALTESNRFIEGMMVSIGLRQTTLEITQRPRFAGTSKYNFRRKLELAFTAIIDFSDKPLLFVVRTGIAVFSLGIVAGLALALYRLSGAEFQLGWPSLMVMMLLGFGSQIFLTGIVGMYVGRTYRETKARPAYAIRALYNFPEEEQRP